MRTKAPALALTLAVSSLASAASAKRPRSNSDVREEREAVAAGVVGVMSLATPIVVAAVAGGPRGDVKAAEAAGGAIFALPGVALMEAARCPNGCGGSWGLGLAMMGGVLGFGASVLMGALGTRLGGTLAGDHHDNFGEALGGAALGAAVGVVPVVLIPGRGGPSGALRVGLAAGLTGGGAAVTF